MKNINLFHLNFSLKEKQNHLQLALPRVEADGLVLVGLRVDDHDVVAPPVPAQVPGVDPYLAAVAEPAGVRADLDVVGALSLLVRVLL